ncbi:SusC/RagA family TonB-linked outer membrane protein [Pseudopedobacter beijingensis]|uniref:SusC/RagA family TonB-linked outer membrane protein n=2 Tax=Pseudopedobacter beijingensis TaxID=1207056 RepID=A0ABW4IAW9_9SPHI
MLIASFLKAQISVSGRVTDSENQPLIGVSIAEKGSANNRVTGTDGSYSINLTSPNSILIFSYIGFGSQEIVLNGRKKINVIMLPDEKKLNEVVVIGYGTVKRRDVTGAISSIKGEDIMKASPSNILSGLQGRVAGVVINQNDGAPGAGLSMQIRGTNSFLGGTQPLYVIDGVPLAANNGSATPGALEAGDKQTINVLSFLNPADVESIDVLRDASATAIYGSRGANGVVLITTKKGRKGADKVELNLNYGFSGVIKKIEMLDAYNYASLQNEAYANSNIFEGTNYELPFPGEWRPSISNPNELFYAKGPEDFIGKSTNWQDEILRTAKIHNHTLTISGGDEKGNYSLSGNYLDQQGVISSSSYKKYGANLNLFRNVKKWLTAGSFTSYSHSENSMVKTNTEDLSVQAGVVRAALAFQPTASIIDSTLNDFSRSITTSNPYLYVNNVLNRIEVNQVFSSNYLEVALPAGFKFRQNIGIGVYGSLRDQYYPRLVYEGMQSQGLAYKSDNNSRSMTSESILSYIKALDLHNISATVGTTYESFVSTYKNQQASNFVNDLLENNNMAGGQTYSPPRSGKSSSALSSVLARVNYSYDSRYMFTVSFRGDGSSKFAKNNKWAFFPSAAIAWNLGREEFLESNKLISEAKMRFSYGRTGNQAINSYQSLSKLIPYNYTLEGKLSSGYADDVWAGPANENLKWETTDQFNAGADVGLLNNKIRFNVDLYYKKTFDLLQNIVTPGSTGFTFALQNVGSIQNKGIEFSLTTTPISSKDFLWNIGGNIAFNRNKILDIGDVEHQFANSVKFNNDLPFIQKAGLPVGALYGYIEDGIFRNEAEVRAHPFYANQSEAIIKRTVGEIRYRDITPDGVLTDKDRGVIGDVNPDFTYGFTTDFHYKKLDLSIFIQGVKGGDVISMNTLYLSNVGAYNNVTKDIYNNRWTPENWEHATNPKAEVQYWRTFNFSRRFVEDGSYIRLKNVNVGYTFNINKRIIEKARVFVVGSNLLTITNYSGFDPDVNGYGENPALRGVDLGGYPNSRTVNFGVQCIF